VFFFAGRHDFNTPSQLVSEFAERVEAPVKQFFWFEESGHSPTWEEPTAFRTRMCEVLQLTGLMQ
jgi:pimeloyl-ACP methyl ester carboxylesterase